MAKEYNFQPKALQHYQSKALQTNDVKRSQFWWFKTKLSNLKLCQQCQGAGIYEVITNHWRSLKRVSSSVSFLQQVNYQGDLFGLWVISIFLGIKEIKLSGWKWQHTQVRIATSATSTYIWFWQSMYDCTVNYWIISWKVTRIYQMNGCGLLILEHHFYH